MSLSTRQTGRYDCNAWFELTEKYFAALTAPTKGLVWFEESSHDLNYSEPARFTSLVRRVVAETWR
jgi:hypothetical protein